MRLKVLSYSLRRASERFAFVVAFLLLAPLTAPNQVRVSCLAGQGEEEETSRQWLLAKSEKPDHGLVLEARENRISPDSVAVPQIVLSIKNVTDSPNNFVVDFLPLTPEAMVRSQFGKPAVMTKLGAELYDRPWWVRAEFGHGFLRSLPPGDALGATYEIGDYFNLNKGSCYKVILWKPLMATLRGKDVVRYGNLKLVANPLTICFDTNERTASARKQKSGVVEKARPSSDGNEPTDAEWASLAARAGKVVRGCTVEAVGAMNAPGSGKLIASLLCVTAANTRDGSRTIRCPEQSDYRLLVRDQFGHVVPELGSAPTVAPHRDSGREDGAEWRLVRPGDGIGAVIPLRKRFDLKNAGEYWVLVWLPSFENDKEPLVAPPLRIRLAAERVEPKKN